MNVGHDGSSLTEYAFILSGGEVNLLNSMRSTENGKLGYRFYTIENNTKLRSYNSQAVDLLYREHAALENIEKDELLENEKIYSFLQPFYKFISFFGKWHTYAEQK